MFDGVYTEPRQISDPAERRLYGDLIATMKRTRPDLTEAQIREWIAVVERAMGRRIGC